MDRRTFLTLAGIGTAGLAAMGPRAIVAGPYDPADAVDHFVPADKKLSPEWIASLFEKGEPTWYEGSDLDTIGMPVGGICAGQVYLTGDGRLVYWDIFNQNFNSGWGSENYREGRLPTSMVINDGSTIRVVDAPAVEQGAAIRVRTGNQTMVRPLNKSGFPGVRFRGEYPIGLVQYRSDDFPVEVDLEAFSPFIPLQAEDSALPATTLNYTIRNRSNAAVEVSLAAWLGNAVCYFSFGDPAGGLRRVNQVIEGEGRRTVQMSVEGEGVRGLSRRRDYGTMSLTVNGGEGLLATAYVPAGDLPDVLFAQDGLATGTETDRTGGQQPIGAVGRTVRLEPGQEEKLTVVVSWFLPNNTIFEDRWVGNYYARRFEDAKGVADYLLTNFDRLSRETRLWRDTYYDSTLPWWLLDRLHYTACNLASSTCLWWRNGRFWAWEGNGCCHGTCGHVWNYAHTVARLFPELERSVREMQDFAPGIGFKPDGSIGFRGEGWDLWAGDAQGGYILKAYREHLNSPNSDFLERNWPNIKKAMTFLHEQDGNADGLIEGRQHQTYDQDYYGPNTFVGSMYLGALRAAEEMAREVGDEQFANRCREIFERGRELTVKHLFNGEYFIQQVDLELHPTDQYKDGCLADQLFGQNWAHEVGLGYIYPEENVKSALASVWKYNWAPDIGPQNKAHEPERWFAYEGEAGLFICTWPKSKHLGPQSTRYRDEVWTGIEYQVAAHMVREGMLTEAFSIVRAIHDRYHPARHNPFNEIECGDHYARALASWGVLTGLQGFSYHGPHGRIGFAPRHTPENFRSMFTVAEGWGTFTQQREANRQVDRIELRWGRLRLNTIVLELPEQAELKNAVVTVAGKPVEVSTRQDGRRVEIALPTDAIVEADERIEVELTF